MSASFSTQSVEPQTVSVRGAAKIIGIGEFAAYRGIKDGSIPHLKFGRKIRVPLAALSEWLKTAGAA
jgi:excisionase family DNA binding protein